MQRVTAWLAFAACLLPDGGFTRSATRGTTATSHVPPAFLVVPRIARFLAPFPEA